MNGEWPKDAQGNDIPACRSSCGKCWRCLERLVPKPWQVMILEPAPVSDLDLERRALMACGYRVHEKERNGTRWLMACKGLQVQYEHWHPLTNIHQAMQLLIDCPGALSLTVCEMGAQWHNAGKTGAIYQLEAMQAQDLINAQCRAIVTACASLQP